MIDAAQSRGDPIPDDAIPPSIPPAFGFSYSAFCELSADRESGFGIGPIRFTAIDAYARRYRIDDLDTFDEFMADLRLIDSIYLSHLPKPKDGK